MRLITFRIIPDGSARSIALETGNEIDMMVAPIPADIARLESHLDIDVHYVTGLGVEYIILNREHIPDVRVRQAINYAIDGPQMVDVITQGTAVYASGFINNITFGHNPNFVGFPYDVERARELMIEAGFSGEAGANDLSIVLNANSENAVRQQSAEIVQSQLREIGIHIEIETPEFNAMMEMIRNREIAMATLGWGTVTGDADYAMFPLFHSSAHSPSTNSSLFESAVVDDLIERARSSADPNERIALYWEAQELIREEAPWILVSNNVIRVPAIRNVRGLTVMAHQGHFFGNVYFAYEE
jgi:peptide/nickel transport system substrate-binding protein